MDKNLSWKYAWVDSESQLAAVAEAVRTEEFVAIDTETAGWETGNERLCLIQIGLPTRQFVFIIDTLRVKSMGALEPLLRAPRPIIVAHNADFEIRQFSSIGVPLNGVVDTLMMSRKLRPDLPSHSLQSCCKYILGLSISKQEQRSNWAQRPLSASQIQYAALDAEVTVKLYQALRAIEAVETIDPDLSIEGLMRELTKAVEERLALMAPIADRVAKLNAREAALRSAMQSRLLAGDQPYEGALGRCKLFHKRNYEIDSAKVRQEFPALAAAAIEEVVDPRKFEILLKEHSVDPGAIAELLKEGASTTRVSISLTSLLDPKPTS